MTVISDAGRRQIVTGRQFVLDAPDHVPAVFGRDREVLWAQGESLLIVGPQGVGKTTVMQQLALHRAGVLEGDLIGYPVAADDRLTLYLALDRPQQIARSFKRMVTDAHADQLKRLIVWKAPLPFNLVKAPEMLLQFVQEISDAVGAPIGTVCADSLNDMASPLSNDEVGAAINRALGGLIAEEIEVCASHHQRKATGENKKPTTLADVFGSTWITAGAGSVILQWGEPGDPIIELTHLKQPAEEVGPLEIAHDHPHGTTSRRDTPDAWTVLQGATATGVTAADAALAIYGPNPSRSQIEKARRKLDRYAKDGHAVKVPARQASDPTTYRPKGAVRHREAPREGVTHPSRTSTNGSVEPHAPHTHPPVTAQHPLKGGGRDRDRGPHDRTDEELQAIIDGAAA
jgi:replicative DNA helicase